MANKAKGGSGKGKKTVRRSLAKLASTAQLRKKRANRKRAGNVATAAGLVAAAGVAAGVAAVLVSRAGTKGGKKDRTVVHVEHDGQRWRVRTEGASGASSTHGNKREATTTARELARSQPPSRLVIHGLDGEILDSHDYP